DGLAEPVGLDRGEHLLALRPVAEDRAAQAGDLPPRLRDRGHERGHALLRDVAPGEDDERRALGRPRLDPGVDELTGEDARLAGEALLAQPPGVEAAEDERAVAGAHAELLDEPADHARAA